MNGYSNQMNESNNEHNEPTTKEICDTKETTFSSNGKSSEVKKSVYIEHPTIAKNEQTGREEIQTQQFTQQPVRQEWQRALTPKYLLKLKCLSIACLIAFFPTGIPSVYFAWKTQRQFDEGILRGDIEKAQKCAKRCERMMILTVVSALLMILVILAIIGKEKLGAQHYNYVYHPRGAM